MPCWYYSKKDLQNTPSFRDAISPETEARYRRDGARFIIDAGAKMGLRYDTCATGVVYFHRFYMFHSFSEFPRCVTAACCLFLAGKVEETPKKCKDLIKITKSMLTDTQFATFKEDPKEEIMTLERILLQTIKFDLMVEHPYAYLVKFAKLIKGDKAKTQKLVQMSWTFINDSLCTTLSLQWEPEVIAIALMYLASRLSKFEINDWQNKQNFKGRWYEFFVEDITLDLLEDICHQVLDLYSKPSFRSEGSSPINHAMQLQDELSNRSLSMTPTTKKLPQAPLGADESRSSAHPGTQSGSSSRQHVQPLVVPQGQNWQNVAHQQMNSNPQQFSQTNPYVAAGMYTSSFMDKEGSQSIQSLVDNQESVAQYAKQFLGHSLSLQQPSGQSVQPVAQHAYQQPLVPTRASPAVPTPTTFQGFIQNDGNYNFQTQSLQGKTQTVYQEASPGTSYSVLPPSAHHGNWR